MKDDIDFEDELFKSWKYATIGYIIAFIGWGVGLTGQQLIGPVVLLAGAVVLFSSIGRAIYYKILDSLQERKWRREHQSWWKERLKDK